MNRTRCALLFAALLAPQTAGLCQSTFGDDVAFLKEHTGVVVLRRGDAQVAVVPGYQCRVMTSSAAGDGGASYGWVNRELIASGKLQPHINVFGGEDRFWLGPEGGQFGLFFKQGSAFDLDHWQTPAPIDSEPFEVVKTTDESITCHRNIHLVNYSNTAFDLDVAREVILRDPAVVVKSLGVDLPTGVHAVAFSTTNTIRNTGKSSWTRRGGLLSIWILGMFNAGPKTTIVVPYRTSPSGTGPIVHDRYFGLVPPERLVDDDGALLFKADANFRSKIGVPPRRAKHVLGSYDADTHTLTLVTFTLPGNTTQYVNSMWEQQAQPFGGDVVNAYNDGPPQPGAKQLGQFYELETSSPALALAPGKSATHTVTTIHLQGRPQDLDGVAVAVLGRGLEKINHAFGN
jgi:hypothetical protein